MRHLILFLLVLLSFSLTAQRGSKKVQPVQGDQRLVGLDTLVNRLLREWHAPGVGIAVVEKDKVLFAGGYGFKDYEQ